MFADCRRQGRKITAYLLMISFVVLSSAFCCAQDPVTPTNAPQLLRPNTAPGITLLEAVRSALAKHPEIQIQLEQVNVNRGLLSQQTAIFDTYLNASGSQSHTYTPLTRLQEVQAAASGVLTSSASTNSSNINASASRLFRNGISVSPVVRLNRLADNLTNTDGLSTSSFDIQLTVPLLRGRGRDAVAAQETAASVEVNASLLDLNQTISQLLASAASNYWNLVAAIKNLQVARGSEERGRSFVENTQALVSADQAPRNDLNNVMANLADRTATRVAAENNVASARYQLAVGIGLTVDELGSLGDPTEDFPVGENQAVPADDPTAITRYFTESLTHRADVLAAKLRVQEAGILVVGAKNQILPLLNFNVTTGYSGLVEGRTVGEYLSSPFRRIQGEDIVGGIDFRFPVGNHLAKGQLQQAQATSRQASLRVTDTERNASASVLTALQELRSAIIRLRSARESVDSFGRALQGEREKFTLGLNSIVDILTTEDRLTSALLNQVNAQLTYAQALVQFRYATGTIVAPDRNVQTVGRDAFVTLPPSVVEVQNH